MDRSSLDIAVPDGVTALVQLPGSQEQELGSGQHHRLLNFSVTGYVRPMHSSCLLAESQSETFQG